MNNAIDLLKREAHARRSISVPNSQTITEYTAKKNLKLAEEHEAAAEALRQMHNKAFADGVLAGVKSLAESCKRRAERVDNP